MSVSTATRAERAEPATTNRAVDGAGSGVLVLTVAAWAVVLALLAWHRVFTSHDTMISYAHVWYVSTRLWHGHGVPFRMPVVGHGAGYAFPYGFVPWMSAALLRPVLGDWVVTLWIVVGAVGTAAATFFALPEL